MIIENKWNKGFTLVELLIVLAIISVLSQTALGLFSGARDKAHDSNVRMSLSSLRGVAVNEYFNYSPNTFSPICGESPVDLILKDLGSKEGVQTVDYQCTSAPDEWVAIFPLKAGGYWCSDSMGNSKKVVGFLDSTAEGSLNCNHATSPNVVVVPPTPLCNDSLDNDGDGLIDYPADPGCSAPADTDETNAPAPPPTYACNDNVDNDSDGLKDYPADPGCVSASDTDETNAPNPVYICNDNIDNDGDGLKDYPADPGCASTTDSDEYNVPANTAPTLTLLGTSPYHFYSKSGNPFSGKGNGSNKYVDPGYTATDAQDGNINSSVIVTGPSLLSSTNSGCRRYTYNFTYNVTDSGGLTAPSVSRTVIHHKCDQDDEDDEDDD